MTTCSACHQESPAGARFCMHCGAALAANCAQCGVTLPDAAKFCPGCGAAVGHTAAAPARAAAERSPRAYTPKHLADRILQSRAALEGERKHVTVLFADVKGSMELAESVDAEEWHRILDRFFAILTDGVHRFEGTVNQYTGDGIMALFGAPLAHEDHAQRSCYAALHLRDALREYADELRLARGLLFGTRIGINSGEVVVGRIGDDLRMDYTAQGPVVGLAQRMEQLAAPGTVLLADATARIVSGYFALRDLGAAHVKGVSDPVHVHELTAVGSLQTRFDASRARGLSEFVGRESEIALLDAALERAANGLGGVVGVVAVAGTGKSRLCFELAERARGRGFTVETAQAVPHGKQVAYLPLLAFVRRLFGIGERDGDADARQKIAGALVLLDASFERILPVWFEFLGVPDAARPVRGLSPEDRERIVLEGLRQMIRGRAARAPTLLLLEDLHWFDDASERAVATLVDAVDGTHALLLVNFRPEFHAGWMQRSQYQQLPLQPLGVDAIAALVRSLVGDDATLTELTRRIAERAGGIPFFAEELVQTLVEDGTLAGTRGAYRLARPVAALTLPANVQAVLAARLDRLDERDKRVLHTAAVVGTEFEAALLARALAVPEAELAPALRSLVQAELIVERSLYPALRYAFKHPLTQDVALQTQLSARRAARHADVARALEATTSAERLDERAAELAYHWQESGAAIEAARWHLRAAGWVQNSSYRDIQRHAREVRALCDALTETQETRDLGIAARAELITAAVIVLTPTVEVLEYGREARELFERGGDRSRMARLLSRLAGYHAVGTRVDPAAALAALDEARALARSSDPLTQGVVRLRSILVLRECGHLREAESVAREGIDDLDGYVGRFSNATYLAGNRGQVRFLLGRLDEAERDLDDAVERATKEGSRTLIWFAFLADLGFWRGDESVVQRWVARCAAVERPDVANDVRFTVLQRGQLHLMRGEWREAAEAFERAAAYGLERALLWLAQVRLELGDVPAARALIERAIADAAERGNVLIEIVAQLVLARVLRRADGLGARANVERALDRMGALIDETGAELYRPFMEVERAALAQLLGDDAGRRRALAEAERLFRAIGAPLRAGAVALELGTS